jgi:hypothetical protein
MTRSTLLSAVTLLVAMTFAPSAIPQTSAAPKAAAVVMWPDEVGSATIDGHHFKRRGRAPSPYGYPWS